MTEDLKPIPLGTGIYSRADASRLLHMHPQRINRWVRGYRYSWKVTGGSQHRGTKPPVVQPDLPPLDGIMVLSFHELMELRIVRDFIARDVPLQKIRRAWEHYSRLFGTTHPFAHHKIFVGHRSIFMNESGDDHLLELSSRQPLQLVAKPIFERSIQEVDFDKKTKLVSQWWPLGRQVPVVLNPGVAFGAPVVQGTRIETGLLAGYVRRSGVDRVAHAFRLDAESVKAAVAFESQLARAA